MNFAIPQTSPGERYISWR